MGEVVSGLSFGGELRADEDYVQVTFDDPRRFGLGGAAITASRGHDGSSCIDATIFSSPDDEVGVAISVTRDREGILHLSLPDSVRLQSTPTPREVLDPVERRN